MNSDFVIIVPAKGSSSRVDKKNLRLLHSKPLLQYTLDMLKELDVLEHSYVSTEDDAIMALAEKSAVGVIKRPTALASSTASTESVLLHAVDFLKEKNIRPQWIVTLPPTSPFRTTETIRRLLDMLAVLPAEYDAILSVTENCGDFWREKNDGSLERLFIDAPRSQVERKERGYALLEENSAFYATKIESFCDCARRGTVAPILGKKVKAVRLSFPEWIDLNTEDDFILAEAILSARHVSSMR